MRPCVMLLSFVLPALALTASSCFPGPLPCDSGGRCGVDSADETTTDVGSDTVMSGDTDTASCELDCGFLDTACAHGVCRDGACVSESVSGPCNDGFGCTIEDHCDDGRCVGTEKTCDDGIACTVDGCSEPSGECEVDVGACECEVDDDCTAGDLCDGVERCVGHACVAGTAVTCPPFSDNGPCLVPACDPVSGECVDVPKTGDVECDDGSGCTTDDTCFDGACVGQARVCNDGRECSVDGCDDEAGGCVFDSTACECETAAQCQDGNLCDGNETCGPLETCLEGTPVTCAPSTNPCKETYCDPATGECAVRDVAGVCDDGNPCTEHDRCQAGTCGGTERFCDPDDACQLPSTCDPETGGCEPQPDGFTCETVIGQEGLCRGGLCQPYLELDLNWRHACALQRDRFGVTGRLKCWGDGAAGALGQGSTENIGDHPDRLAEAAPDIALPSRARAFAVAPFRTCAVLADKSVRCWGSGLHGAHGYGSEEDILAPRTDAVDIGLEVQSIAMSEHRTCVVTVGGHVACWGSGDSAANGNASYADIGATPDALPSSAGFIYLGLTIDQVIAGQDHTCVYTIDDKLRCWGSTLLLGTGADDFGDTGATPPVDLPNTPIMLADGSLPIRLTAASANHTCALHDDASARCWGAGNAGLGQGSDTGLVTGPPPSIVPIDIGVAGATILDIRVSRYTTCVLYAASGARRVKCFGESEEIFAGPESLPALEFGGDVQSVAVANGGEDPIVCAVMRAAGKIRCRGLNLGTHNDGTTTSTFLLDPDIPADFSVFD